MGITIPPHIYIKDGTFQIANKAVIRSPFGRSINPFYPSLALRGIINKIRNNF